MFWSIILAAAVAEGPKWMEYLTLATCALVVIVGIPLIYYLRRETKECDSTPEELLARFSQARDAGDMEDVEFRQVRELLKQRMSQRLAAEATQPAATRNAERDPKAAAPAQDAPAVMEPSPSATEPTEGG
jgi:hypothetical protein